MGAPAFALSIPLPSRVANRLRRYRTIVRLGRGIACTLAKLVKLGVGCLRQPAAA